MSEPGGGNPRARSDKARRRGGRLLGLAAAAGLCVGMTPLAPAPSAHADIEDLIVQPIIDTVEQVASWLDPADFATGFDVDGALAPALAAGDTPESATIPIDITAGTEPVANISVGGGSDVPVVVDTGSNGLVLPWWDIGWQDLGFPTDFGIGQYSGGLDYFYVTLPTSVGFSTDGGGDILAQEASVNAVLFTWPTSWENPFWSLPDFLGPAHAQGVLGLGADAVGPDHGPNSVLEALPGHLGDGVLFNEPDRELIFGPDPLAGDSAWVGHSANGVADADLKIQVNGGDIVSVNSIIDSGGVYGTIPASVFDGGSAGDTVSGTVSVYNSDGDLLYTFETPTGGGPTVVSGDTMNTGYWPFADNPVYIDGAAGSTTFYSKA